ncbi:MAG: hypothetical protein WC438_03405 [Candidatus Pacearchaeota archaeon]
MKHLENGVDDMPVLVRIPHERVRQHYHRKHALPKEFTVKVEMDSYRLKTIQNHVIALEQSNRGEYSEAQKKELLGGYVPPR